MEPAVRVGCPRVIGRCRRDAIVMAEKSVYIIGNPRKPKVRPTLELLREWIATRARVVGADLGCDAAKLAAADPDFVVVLGGDGSILGVARALGANQKPIIGVNLGKLGYLAEFTVDEFRQQFERLLAEPQWISRRMMLDVRIEQPAEPFTTWAINDCVIHAGPPFRLIELEIHVDGTRLATLAGDGLIIATPGGSTAHNMSAGGPILQPGLDAIVITPICPHSLAFRPIAVEGHSTIRVVAATVNPGTTVSVDGQLSTGLLSGDALIVKRSSECLHLARNPAYPAWHTLLTKLHWGRGLS